MKVERVTKGNTTFFTVGELQGMVKKRGFLLFTKTEIWLCEKALYLHDLIYGGIDTARKDFPSVQDQEKKEISRHKLVKNKDLYLFDQIDQKAKEKAKKKKRLLMKDINGAERKDKMSKKSDGLYYYDFELITFSMLGAKVTPMTNTSQSDIQGWYRIQFPKWPELRAMIRKGDPVFQVT